MKYSSRSARQQLEIKLVEVYEGFYKASSKHKVPCGGIKLYGEALTSAVESSFYSIPSTDVSHYLWGVLRSFNHSSIPSSTAKQEREQKEERRKSLTEKLIFILENSLLKFLAVLGLEQCIPHVSYCLRFSFWALITSTG